MTVTREQAEAVLAAVREQFKSYLEPLVIDGEHYAPACPEPKLVMDYDGHPAICWEDGPGEWAHRASLGGTSEEERVLAEQAAEEFSVPYALVKPEEDAPLTLPPGVSAEPIYSFVLAVYPA